MQTISEVIAEHFSDPVSKTALENAREEMRRMREFMGDEAYFNWVASHFIGIAPQSKEGGE